MKKNGHWVPERILLILAMFVSLLGQGFCLAPKNFAPLLQFLSALGNLTPGIILLAIALLIFAMAIRRTELNAESRRHTTILLEIQFIAAIGILILLKDSASPAQQTGFVLGSVITVLTTLGICFQLSATMSSDPTSDQPTSSASLTPASDMNALVGQIEILTERFSAEKRRTIQLTFLNELSKQLEAELELEVAAQLAVNTLAHAIEGSIVSIMWHDPEKEKFTVLTSAGGYANFMPPGYEQDSSKGVLGRTTRLKKTQLVNDTRLDPDFLPIKNRNILSIVSVPVLQHHRIRSVIEICAEKPFAFGTTDVTIAEDVGIELMRAWERVSYHQRLKELIQAGISLTNLLDPQAAVQEIALITQRTLEARFVFVTLLDQQGNFSRTASAGEAHRLLSALGSSSIDQQIVRAALNATRPFRIRDIRKYATPGNLDADDPHLRNAIAIPIRLHRLSIGTILAFGKKDGVSFSENDESLGGLLSSQAAAAIESSWLYHELRSNLNTTSMLYQLSVDVIQAEELSRAAELIAQAAQKLTGARNAGIVLMTSGGQVEAAVEIDATGFHSRREHPQDTIDQAIKTGQSIIASNEAGSLVCYPLLTRGGTYGALWMNIAETRGHNFANLHTLANQAAIALERAILLTESQLKTEKLKAAYAELEVTYDRTLTSLMSALDARDRETEGHSVRVSRLACLLAEQLGLSEIQIKVLERGALLHDIGKIGVSDTILHKPDKLTDDEWRLMRVHPDIGARIVEGIPFLKETVSVIRYHHERWDGSGYPVGLRGKEIPTQARIFAVADVFDALTSRRKYREKSSRDDALKFLRENSGTLFDPDIVEALSRISYKTLTDTEQLKTS